MSICGHNDISAGDVGVLSTDQKWPGTVRLKAPYDGIDHEPMRLRRLGDYKGISAQELAIIHRLIKDEDFEAIVYMIKKARNASKRSK